MNQIVSPVNGIASLEGLIIDAESDQPLPGTSVTIVDANGNYMGDGVAADREGVWFLSSDLFLHNFIKISHVGYVPGIFKSEDLYPFSVIAMSRDSAIEELPPVVVTHTKKKISLLPVLLIGIGIILFTRNS